MLGDEGFERIDVCEQHETEAGGSGREEPWNQVGEHHLFPNLIKRREIERFPKGRQERRQGFGHLQRGGHRLDGAGECLEESKALTMAVYERHEWEQEVQRNTQRGGLLRTR